MRWWVWIVGRICSALVAVVVSDAFSMTRTSFVPAVPSRHFPVPQAAGRAGGHVLAMRDASVSYWFRAGDRVRVVEDVRKGGDSLRGRVGRVRETWEKCDVDPTCCCAEQVDIGMSVRVEFQNATNGGEAFDHYFAESELIKVDEG